MDDKELISQLHTVANTMRIRGMAGYAPEVEAAASRLRELAEEVSAARELLDANGYYRGWQCDNLTDNGRGEVPRPLEALRRYIAARKGPTP